MCQYLTWIHGYIQLFHQIIIDDDFLVSSGWVCANTSYGYIHTEILLDIGQNSSYIEMKNKYSLFSPEFQLYDSIDMFLVDQEMSSHQNSFKP